MKIKVLFFGATAEIVGLRELEIANIEPTTAKSLLGELSETYPALSRHKLLVAVNEQYLDPNGAIKDGDEVAVFTAVSGG